MVPNALATNDANSLIDVPAGPATLRYMMIVDASQFSALSGPSLITQFAFRLDGSSQSPGPRVTTTRIYASTTKRSVAGMSKVFKENIGTNNTLVYDGTFTQMSQNLPGPGNTRQFDLITRFTTPFLYDPAQGNLVLDVQTPKDDGEAITYDAVTDDPTVRSLISIGPSTASAGDFAVPQVTQFTLKRHRP